ncbi:glutamine-hydrolyzing carbamoyl-phosphate synthase small subunit [Aquicella lusitana]|uniref:Carbamoyl phosphate synthase small chain n=1 Tax=Aquicella lusitana TaxID=254246 RepID=A0A370GDY8_9COXI|nr:glutamine-hydrolyzing carbamoyl-phosphate synthase small subunit [Aquicella lusitana]RDI41309.1 carbamoyl-phosphate synthase small subunit [Aquicella lusitana]VVC72324.1 Carbamoyl-phosphate synthase arginine-specific small chain [Aquicella lusitana]
MLPNAQLVLQSGEVFYGTIPDNQEHPSFGEVVFNTGMVGYAESLTDPSYAGQILVFTYPLIGNYGVAERATWESQKIHVRGVIVSELSPFYSNHAAQSGLAEWLADQKIPVLTGVDTRAVTKVLRTQGVAPGAIAPLHAKLDHFENFDQHDWVREVSIKEPCYYGSGTKTIIAIDCGMKENILRSLLAFPVRIKRVPYDYDFTQEAFDGVFISNGPGDPTRCGKTVEIIRKAMAKQKPVFGICLGTQLMALAVGATTYKLPFGHRSHNQPCLDLSTNRCYLTSQNHGYAIDENSLPADWRVSFRNLNDNSVAGIEHQHLPFFSVQFHPEAAPGPEDSKWLFQKFFDLLN